MPDCSRLILPTLFCPPPAYYHAMLMHDGPVIIDTATRFDKRMKQAHRCRIADTRGPMELTVPIAKPYGPTWNQVAVSLHGNWWEVHRLALESAYGRTPYYEFYADDFNRLFDPTTFTDVAELNCRFDVVIRRCLGLPVNVTHAPLSTPDVKMPPMNDLGPYWQVRADKFGYISGLSILDMLFNLGPESLLILSR